MMIRLADKSDVSRLVALDKKAHFETKWWMPMKRPAFLKVMKHKDCLFVAEENNRIVGYISGEVSSVRGKKRINLENVFIEKRFRNKGVAKRLVDAFISKWKERGLKEMVLFCPQRLERFYKKFGFKLTVIRMKLDLKT